MKKFKIGDKVFYRVSYSSGESFVEKAIVISNDGKKVLGIRLIRKSDSVWNDDILYVYANECELVEKPKFFNLNIFSRLFSEKNEKVKV